MKGLTACLVLALTLTLSVADGQQLYGTIKGRGPDRREHGRDGGNRRRTASGRQRDYNTGIIDQSKTNAERYPTYHSLNVRVDRRFFLKGSNKVTYLSAWDVYNRKNVAIYYWNEDENRQDIVNQWSLMPVFGSQYELQGTGMAENKEG